MVISVGAALEVVILYIFTVAPEIGTSVADTAPVKLAAVVYTVP